MKTGGLWLLLLLLSGCRQPAAPSPMGEILGRDQPGFERVVAGKPLQFPQDHLAHPGFRQEWWYLTANLSTDAGQPLGLQWTQFRFALAPEPSSSSSPWASRQLYMAHAALTLPQQQLTAERWGRGMTTPGAPAQVSGPPLAVTLDDWQWQTTALVDGPNAGLLPATLTVTTPQFAFRLQLQSKAALVLPGDQGYSVKSADGKVASYYYSQPFIQVDGQVLQDQQWQHVQGQAWLDREWSSEFLSRQQQGWDWFALHLADGSALMLFQLRNSDVSQAGFIHGQRIFADGRRQVISAEQVQLRPIDWYQSPQGRRYPVGWQLTLSEPALSLQISPLNAAAEMPLSVPYWEGPVQVSGDLRGNGYLELTGY